MRASTIAVAVLALACGLAPDCPAGDDLFYFLEDGSVVFTNTPSRADARVVPGYRGKRLPDVATLPATPYDRFIEQLARRHGLSPGLIKAVVAVESGFDPTAVSPKGAIGLMQLMPATARRYGVRDPRDLKDPYLNLEAGARHLRDLLDEFGGDLELALAAYNAGSGAVRRHGGVPAYRETQDYVRKVHGRLGKRARSGGPPVSSASPIEARRRSDGSVVFSN